MYHAQHTGNSPSSCASISLHDDDTRCLLILLRRGVYASHTIIKEGVLSSPEVPSLDIQAGS